MKYWKDVEDKDYKPVTGKEEYTEELFNQFTEVSKNRRSFLKLMGFSITALPLTSCIRIPVRKALPYLNKNDVNVPGVAMWYASTCSGCTANCAILVKNREGRPIKIEGNPLSPVSKGGICAVAQASTLDLYDSFRFLNPKIDGADSDWINFDLDLRTKLLQSVASGKEIVVVSDEFSSPSTFKLIEEFKKEFKGTTHFAYSATSMGALATAHQTLFGIKNYPNFDFDKVDYLVSVGADFLGTWVNPVAFTKGYSGRKALDSGRDPLKHVQVESIMSLSGTNADERIVIDSHVGAREFIGAIYDAVLGTSNTKTTNSELKADAVRVASELLKNKGKSLLLCGHNDDALQLLTAAINQALSNYGKALSITTNPYNAIATDLNDFIQKAEKGSVGAVLFIGVNPAYTYRNPKMLTVALAKVPVKVSFATAPDETSKLCTHVAPANHFLESWNDHYSVGGHLTLTQPTISPLYGSRIWQESLLKLMNSPLDYFDYIKKNWQESFFKLQKNFATAEGFFERSLHDGYTKIDLIEKSGSYNNASLASAFQTNNKIIAMLSKESALFRLVAYQKVAIRDGKVANNPWLQELPDPVTKATWGNYLQVSPSLAKEMSLTSGDVVTVSDTVNSFSTPVLVQPGLYAKTVALAMGYGHDVGGKVAKDLGINAYPFDGAFVTLTKTGARSEIATTQTHHSMEGRDLVREVTLAEFKKNSGAGNENKVHLISMWDEHKKGDHKWGMVVDLNKCTGCSGCIVSCNAENNIAVVGKQEVLNRREMHWLRIDRYYGGDDKNPKVLFQPIMCQHCDNAPCETVCPVLATVQSSDGLNQQVYNRCVGTRYCANNCPYKVRRFNWFNYPKNDPSERMSLNPDVVVRSRGVMEKCSMCVQRIQEGKLTAKKDGRALVDGEIKLACEQSCPADAIIFGDLLDKDSKISKVLSGERDYRILEELNVQPVVNYLTKVRS